MLTIHPAYLAGAIGLVIVPFIILIGRRKRSDDRIVIDDPRPSKSDEQRRRWYETNFGDRLKDRTP